MVDTIERSIHGPAVQKRLNRSRRRIEGRLMRAQGTIRWLSTLAQPGEDD